MNNYRGSLSLCALLSILLGGCAAGMVQTSQAIPTKLLSKAYNDLSSQYLDRPTFVSIEVMKDGGRVLHIRVNGYEPVMREMMFFERDREKYVAAVDKYLQWEVKAVRNGDILEKEIDAIPTPIGNKIGFIFSSGNASIHYLNVSWVMGSPLGKITGGPILTLDQKNAVILKELLVAMPNIDARPKADDYK